MEILDSAATAALSQRQLNDETTGVALSASSELLSNPYVIIPATTYDIEMINGLSALMARGMIHDGDTIGHIWLEGDYGANGLRGAQYFAQRHHLRLREAQVTTTSAISDIVAAFAAEPRVRAIALSPAAGTLHNLSVVASSVPFSSATPKARHVATAYQRAGYREPPNSGVPYGYAIGQIWGQLLTRACVNGDMSRSGIQEALRQLTTITTDHLIAGLSFAKPGAPASRETYLGVPDPGVAGGIREVTPLFESPDAQSYVAPHQNSS
jgi:hypothetical protein